jgi:hypothetical protein
MPIAIRIVRIVIVNSISSRPDLGPSNSIDFRAIRELCFSVTWQYSFIRFVRVGFSVRVMVTRISTCARSVRASRITRDADPLTCGFSV